jgi:short-chain Z-isoprenyl diphosphate synthase
MASSDPIYRLYEARLERQLRSAPLPRHVGVILDGNRRFATERGDAPMVGHAAGARKIHEFLSWCHELEVPYVTLWMLSTDNLHRDDDELRALLDIISDTVAALATDEHAQARGQRVSAVGALDLLPDDVKLRLTQATESTKLNTGMHVQVAVGYGGRREIMDAMRSLLLDRAAAGETVEQIAEHLTPDDLARHLYATDVPDPDLIIRTSGEIRLSGFLLWQSAHSEFHFADPYWPAFRRVDFLRALRDYQARVRRFGR